MEIRAKKHRVVLDIPKDLKLEFKAAVAIRGEDMTSILYKFIKSYVGRHNAQLQRIIDKYRDKGEFD